MYRRYYRKKYIPSKNPLAPYNRVCVYILKRKRLYSAILASVHVCVLYLLPQKKASVYPLPTLEHNPSPLSIQTALLSLGGICLDKSISGL